MDQEVSAIQFLESYVMSNNRLKTVTENFNEETEEYWRYSLLYMLNKSNGANDAQVDAFLQKLSQSKFSKNGFIENLLFRNQLRKFDQGSRPELIEKIKAILGGSNVSCDEKEEKEVIEVSDEKKDASNNNISTSVGTLVNSRGTIEVDIPSAIAMFLTQSTEQYLLLAEFCAFMRLCVCVCICTVLLHITVSLLPVRLILLWEQRRNWMH